MKLFISCGETSGDIYAARLIKALNNSSELELSGNGGEHMEREGCHLLFNVTSHSTIGFIEPLLKLAYFYNVWKKTTAHILKQQIQCVLIIDHQGFNIRLAKWCKKRGVRVVSFIAPQFWMWGKKQNALKFCSYCDHIFCVFQKEYEFYSDIAKDKVTYVGHPLTNMLPRRQQSDQTIIGIFPGSRVQEILLCFPTMLDVANDLTKKDPNLIIKVAAASSDIALLIEQKIKTSGVNCHIVRDSHALIAEASASIVTSGTVSLEHAIIGTPCVVMYRFYWLSYWVARLLILKKINKYCHGFFALPNILAKKEVCPEFLQDKATKEHILNAIQRILNHNQEQMLDEFNKIKQQSDDGDDSFRLVAEAMFDTSRPHR